MKNDSETIMILFQNIEKINDPYHREFIEIVHTKLTSGGVAFEHPQLRNLANALLQQLAERQPQFGDKLKNGATVIQSEKHKGQWTVLCGGWNDVTPFVVWRMDAEGNTGGGDYCATLEGALSAFNERTGKKGGDQ